MRRGFNRKQNMTVAIIIAAFCFMAIGYALINQQLKINGIAKTTGSWNIQITKIESKAIGSANNKTEPTGIGTTNASFNIDMYKPGDAMEYTITLSNLGNIDAIVKEIEVTNINSEYIKYTIEDIKSGYQLKANNSKPFKLKIEFDENATSTNKGASENINLNIDISQESNSNITAIEKVTDANVVTTGDGLYEDSTEPGRYIYRGANPNNYITFNNEEWRIVSIENDGAIKIIKSTSIGEMPWDEKGNRDSSTSTYCKKASDYGCNAWAATNNLVGQPNQFVAYSPTGKITDANVYSGTVTKDSSLNTYLNGDYYNNTLGIDKKYIVAGNFYVGSPGTNADDSDDIATNVAQEKQYTWNGKVGLIQITDYFKTSTDNTCTTLKNIYGSSNVANCGTTNWLKPNSGWIWTISTYANSNRRSVWTFGSNDYSNGYTFNAREVLPVVYLSSSVKLTGVGTSSNPYKIIKTINDIKSNVVTEGDGLYADSTELGRYIFRGANPNNYITFNNEDWRIISLEKDGTMKIVKANSIGQIAWDSVGARSSSTNTYCTDAANYGCNAWAATSNLIGQPSTFNTGPYSGTVTKDASLNIHLNGTYYNSLGTNKNYIVKHDFYVGTPGDWGDKDSISINMEQEKQYIWKGYIGLIQATDFLKASTDNACTTLNSAFTSTKAANCGTTNWLKPTKQFMWTISPYLFNKRDAVWIVNADGYFKASDHVGLGHYAYPSLFLSSKIQLKGNGTLTNKYEIVG